jgi:hypothetical protein
MADRNVEGTEAESRFEFGRRPAFGDEVGYAGYIGARRTDDAPLRSLRAVGAAALLSAAILVGVLLFVLLH